MKFGEKLFQTKLLSRLSLKVCRLLSSPVLLRKFTINKQCDTSIKQRTLPFSLPGWGLIFFGGKKGLRDLVSGGCLPLGGGGVRILNLGSEMR